MNVLAMLGALAVIFIAGYGLTRWLMKGEERVWSFELLGYSWIFGTGVVSGLLAVAGMCVRGPLLVAVVAVASVILGLVGLRKSGGQLRPRFFPDDTQRWEIALTFLSLVPIGFLTVQTFRETLHWDGLLVWEIKARIAFQNGGAVPITYFPDVRLLWSHPAYPLYLPMLELWVYLWLGEMHQFLVKAIFPIFYLAAACVLWSAGLRLTGRVWLGSAATLLLFSIPRVVGAQGGVLQGYADFPLAVIYLAAFAALLHSVGGERCWVKVAALASALLPWVKQEGVVLWVCFAITAAWLWRRDRRTALMLIAPGLVTLLAWRAFLSFAEVAHETTFQPLSVATLGANLTRLPPLLHRVGEEFIRLRAWSLLWPLTAMALGILLCQRQRSAAPLAFGIIAPLALYLIPYLFTTMQPWEMHVETSLDRLILQLAPLAILPLVLVLGEKKRRRNF